VFIAVFFLLCFRIFYGADFVSNKDIYITVGMLRYAGRCVVLRGPVANVCVKYVFIWCSRIPTNDANIIHESINNDMTVNCIIQQQEKFAVFL